MLSSMPRLVLLLLLLLASPAWAQDAVILSERDLVHPAFGRHSMVVSQEEQATRIGVEVLRRGGNAVDAAVAVGFALAVTLPRAGNLGGGGFMLVPLADSGATHALDYRETAPAAASRDMFLNAAGEVDVEKARYSHAAAAVPGTVAGLVWAAEHWGSMPLRELIAPAVRLAGELTVPADLADTLNARRERFEKWPASRAIFVRPDGKPWEVGDRLVQADLADTLGRIADFGAAGFYSGRVAEAIGRDMAANGGLIAVEDLLAYRPALREPARGSYRGWQVAAMPPPSSGGAHLVQLLNILEGYPLAEMGHNAAATIHVMAEAMKLAYADRAEHLGDPDFWPVPLAGLVSKAYAAKLRAQIDPARARPAAEIRAGAPALHEGEQTTHFSVVDGRGNAVANTYTINFSYGSGIVAAGTGVLLNNEMDDFSAKPGVPNAYGLLGGEANAIAPGKRPLSSMTPTILFRDGRPALVTGSPGGSLIITTVLQLVLNVVDHGMNVAEAAAAPRVHHQWLPDELRVEEGLSPDTLRLLRELGHKPVVRDSMGATMSILRVEGGWTGAADPRRRGGLALGE
jgi:gamma-glutamyltranspeptidase / glutathione hydrolase